MKDKRYFVYILFLTFIYFLGFFNLSVNAQTVLKGGISTVIEKGQILKINLNTPVNFYYSQVGDRVVGFLNEEISVGENFYIPKGSRLEGIITDIKNPKTFGRDGAFKVDFNEIVTPENVTIPIYASTTTDAIKPIEKIANILTYDSALIAYGSLHGVIAGLQYGGLPLAVTSHGISLLAGAGVGAGAGIVGSVVRKGKIPTTSTFQTTKVSLDSNLYVFGELPKLEELRAKSPEIEEEYKGFRFNPPLNADEIELSVNKIRKEHSKEYGNYIIVEFNLINNSQRTLNLSDLTLVSKQELKPVNPDLFLSGNEVLKSIPSQSQIISSLAFLVSQKIDSYSLVLIDSLDGVEVVKIPLSDD